MRGRLAALAACAVLSLSGACAEAPPQTPVRTILIVGGASFGGSDRVVHTLNDMVGSSDVLGETRFVLEAPEGARPADLPALLARHPEAQTAIVVVGGLAVLEGIDPSVDPAASGRLTSRDVPRAQLRALLDRLQAVARSQGTELLLATAPLGVQAHVEVPELSEVAQLLRERGPVVDLEAALHALEPAPLFTNGIDRLDAWGHDEVARALFALCCREEGPLPPRDAAERSARLQARALAAFAEDRREDFDALAQQALAAPALDPALPSAARDAVRRAAIASARDGLQAQAARWEAIGGSAEGVPGLALGRELLRDPSDTTRAPATPSSATPPAPSAATQADAASAQHCSSGLEAALVDCLQALRSGDARALSLAEACVDAHPERLEAWIVLQVVALAFQPQRNTRPELRAELLLYPRSAVAVTLAERLLAGWPAPLDALPALLLASRPFERVPPTGPLLETARRRAALGFIEHAQELLSDGLRQHRVPPSWQLELARIAALPPP